jgi:uncharacterized membrane protein required for colicin V production
MLFLILLVVFGACFVLLFSGGLWRNTLRLVNVVFAALLAVNCFEPVANRLEDTMGKSYTYFCDVVALWGVFAVSLAVFRILTELASRATVAFGPRADRVGGAACGAMIGWVMVCLTVLSLHIAPLPRCFLGTQPEEPCLMGLGPDRMWLGFVQQLSRGAFSGPVSAENLEAGSWGFDPQGAFLLKYNVRRAALEDHVRLHKSVFVND